MIKLNLGCGFKKLEGYINVDAEICGTPPDVISDIRKLDLPDNYADEILAVHLIEHINRWEVDDMLRDWIRVLKPGGWLIVECPNIMTACKAIVARGERSTVMESTPETMWELYGSPYYKSEFMSHKWGYTPTSLKMLFRHHGLKRVAQDKCRFRKKEPRDMRVIGRK